VRRVQRCVTNTQMTPFIVVMPSEQGDKHDTTTN
jgi:hypothetical protein